MFADEFEFKIELLWELENHKTTLEDGFVGGVTVRIGVFDLDGGIGLGEFGIFISSKSEIIWRKAVASVDHTRAINEAFTDAFLMVISEILKNFLQICSNKVSFVGLAIVFGFFFGGEGEHDNTNDKYEESEKGDEKRDTNNKGDKNSQRDGTGDNDPAGFGFLMVGFAGFFYVIKSHETPFRLLKVES